YKSLLILFFILMMTVVAQDGVLRGHIEPVNGVAFSPDGRWLISVSDDLSVRVWDVDARTLYKELYPHRSFVRRVVFNLAGDRMVTTSWDGTANVFRVQGETFTTEARIPNFGSPVDAAAFSLDQTRLALGVGDGTIRLMDTATWQEVSLLVVDGLHIRALDFSPSFDTPILAAAVGFPALQLYLWEPDTDTPFAMLDFSATDLAFLDETTLIAVSDMGEILRWQDWQDEDEPTITTYEDVWFTSLAVYDDQIAAGTLDGEIYLWQDETLTVIDGGDPINDLAFSVDGTLLAAGTDAGTVRLIAVDRAD
ncbi:MAG: hypothetical protein CUN56_13695, partial [Phototrophicales bacterium]